MPQSPFQSGLSCHCIVLALTTFFHSQCYLSEGDHGEGDDIAAWAAHVMWLLEIWTNPKC
jgi:hypothetical protein